MGGKTGGAALATSLLALVCGAALLAAAPRAAAAPGDCDALPATELLLKHINELRAVARSCGPTAMPRAAALRWDARLEESARRYARELAARDQISHEGQGQRSLRERLRSAGYRMRLGGETLAAGPENLDQLLEQWLGSAAHCENLMSEDFRDMGLACAAAPGRYGRFWVLHLGQELRD